MLSAFVSRYVTHFRKPGFGSPGGLPSRDLILPLCTKIASLAGRGCGYDLLQQLEGGGRCGNSALQVGVKRHDGQASVLVARCLALSGISVCPSSSWRSAFIYLKLMFDKPSYYLEDLKLLRMGGRGSRDWIIYSIMFRNLLSLQAS